MLKIIFFALLMMEGSLSFAQHPFNYGKNKKVYYFSRKEITRSGIIELLTATIPDDGKNNEEAELSIISFADTNYITDGWFPYYGSSTRKLTLKQIRDSSYFMNGHFYQLDENGKLSMGGMEGRGALCQSEYYHDDSLYTLVVQFCKYDPTATANKIYYHANGLPAFRVCCKTDSSGVVPIEDSATLVDTLPVDTDAAADIAEDEFSYTFFRKNDSPWHYTDTTWYIYDTKWRILGTKTAGGFKDIFKTDYNYNGQWYINATRFETYIDKRIGYRPALVLFEIYRNAVFSFRYDEKEKMYLYNGPVTLE